MTKYNNYKDLVKSAFRGIPDLLRRKSQQEEIEEQGEQLINQSIEIQQQTKEIKDIKNDKSSK